MDVRILIKIDQRRLPDGTGIRIEAKPVVIHPMPINDDQGGLGFFQVNIFGNKSITVEKQVLREHIEMSSFDILADETQEAIVLAISELSREGFINLTNTDT